MKKGILDSVVRVRAETVTTAQFEFWKKKYTIMGDDGPFEMYRVQEDTILGKGHPQPALILPRSAANVYGNDLEDRRTWGEPMTRLVRRTWKPRKGQEEAVTKLLEQFNKIEVDTHILRGGNLVSPCGSGKTVMGAELAIRLGRKTAVLVHKEFLAKQWEAAFHMLAPNISIGRVRRAECTFRDKDVVIIMCQSLVGKTTKQEYPKEMFNSFGLVICDEVHRYAAEVWQEAIVRFPAMVRLGLTATYRRRDGLIEVIDHHIGGIAHEVQVDTLPVRVHPVQLSTKLERHHYRFRWNNELNRGGLISALAGNEQRTRIISETIMKALEANRKVLVLSERRKHLDEMANICCRLGFDEDSIGFFIGGKKEEALDQAAERPLILATYAMAREGLDIPAVDTLIMATPVVDIQQSVGRIIRPLVGKKEPVVIDYIDARVPPCAGFASARRRMYDELGYDVQ